MKTKKELETIAAEAKITARKASDVASRAEGALVDAQNVWADLDRNARDAQRAVDEWKEPVAPITLDMLDKAAEQAYQAQATARTTYNACITMHRQWAAQQKG
jgi:hypothetical protein